MSDDYHRQQQPPAAAAAAAATAHGYHYQQQQDTDEGTAAVEDAYSSTTASNLDHALLESLFYNEMMLLDESPSLLLSTLAADGTPTSVDPSTLAEKALLHDFGVSSFELQQQQQQQAQQLAAIQRSSHEIASTPALASATSPLAAAAAVAASTTAHLPPLPVSMPATDHSRTATAPIPTTTMTIPSSTTPGAPPLTVNATVAENNPVPTSAPAAGAPAPAPAPLDTADGDRDNRKLVSQFATLASRLGISLPPHLLQSLTTQAGSLSRNTPSTGSSITRALHPPSAPLTLNALIPSTASSASEHQTTQPASAVPVTSSQTAMRTTTNTLAASSTTSNNSKITAATTTSINNSDLEPPPQVQALQSTAEAAIAAVTRKRPANGASDGGVDDGPTTSTSTATSTTKQPAYSKRRKKPRLSDCELRLSELQTENAMLKRHLDNITSQSHLINQEQKEIEAKIRLLWKQKASDVELKNIVNLYMEMYSDYGKRRQAELTFHLEQLERLAKPTNFTKMTLWTMGQSQGRDPKKNPLAGMLQKELNITPQQGRKILEQRQRIRDLCGNLKEVSVMRCYVMRCVVL